MLPHHVVLYAVSRFHKHETSQRLTVLFDKIDKMDNDVAIHFVYDAKSGQDSVCNVCLKRQTVDCVSDLEAEQQMAIYIKDALRIGEHDHLTVRSLRYVASDECLTNKLNGDFGMVALRLSQRRSR